MRNHEVTKVQRLLNEDGTLKEPGWSRKLYQIYDRNDIKKRATRIKEWDYYLVLAKDYGVAFTISDDGYIGLSPYPCSISEELRGSIPKPCLTLSRWVNLKCRQQPIRATLCIRTSVFILSTKSVAICVKSFVCSRISTRARPLPAT